MQVLFLPFFAVLLFCTHSWHPSVFCIFVFLYFLYFCIFVILFLMDFFTFCTFVLLNLVRQSIWTSMQNLKSVAQKMSELWVHCTLVVLKKFIYICTLFGQSMWTSMENLESIAQKWLCYEYFRTYGLFCTFCTSLICSDYPYKLPYKIWSL